MSGHSKWSTIKRQKAVTDSRRSAAFTKLARLITVAARAGGVDPDMNIRLRLAIDKARAANMPNSNIERAVSAGAGSAHSDQAKEVVYEGFGPAGVAIVVEAVTDNSNRTAADMRSLFSRHGGSLGSLNSVSWMFTARGAIRIPTADLPTDHDNFTLSAIDAGAEDVIEDDEDAVFYTPIASLPNLKSWLEKQGLTPSSAGLELVATNKTPVSEADQGQLYALLEDLDEHPDVINFFTNEA